jgi:hypothetical protein
MVGEHGKRDAITYQWSLPDGTICRMTLFDVTAAEAADAAKACGWPGWEPLSSRKCLPPLRQGEHFGSVADHLKVGAAPAGGCVSKMKALILRG